MLQLPSMLQLHQSMPLHKQYMWKDYEEQWHNQNILTVKNYNVEDILLRWPIYAET